MTNVATKRTPRDAVDPERTLPRITLKLDPEKRQPRGSLIPEQYLINSDDMTIGHATITHNTRAREAWFNGVEINEELRGSGYGLATYLAAIENAHGRGETFRTHDWSQTEAAAKVWERFIDAGVAEVVEPFVPYGRVPGDNQQQLYSGHVRITPT